MAVRPAATFWPLHQRTGQIVFRGSLARPTAPALVQAEHARAWLTGTGITWTERQIGVDTVQLFTGQLAGIHAGEVMRFELRLSRRSPGWHYQLGHFEVRSPTGQPGLVHWLPLHRLLEDADFKVDVASFQQQLRRALPAL